MAGNGVERPERASGKPNQSLGRRWQQPHFAHIFTSTRLIPGQRLCADRASEQQPCPSYTRCESVAQPILRMEAGQDARQVKSTDRWALLHVRCSENAKAIIIATPAFRQGVPSAVCLRSLQTHGYRWWKTADFSDSAGTAHGAPPMSTGQKQQIQTAIWYFQWETYVGLTHYLSSWTE